MPASDSDEEAGCDAVLDGPLREREEFVLKIIAQRYGVTPAVGSPRLYPGLMLHPNSCGSIQNAICVRGGAAGCLGGLADTGNPSSSWSHTAMTRLLQTVSIMADKLGSLPALTEARMRKEAGIPDPLPPVRP